MMSCGLCDFGVPSNTTPQKSGTSSNASETQTSPLSIIEQWQRDAKGAVEDAYANYVLGDDTGESARLVLVSSPSDDISLLENTGHGRHPPHVLLNDPHTRSSRKKKQSRKHSGNSASSPPANSNLLLFSHLDFYTDANRHNLMGLQRTNNKHDPHISSFMSCGVTFVEINGRAYVHALDEESAAYRSGVRPRDSVQYAAVLAKEWEDPMGGDFDPISSQALEREDSGQRINYEELKRVFLQASGILGDLSNARDIYEEYEHQQSGHVVMGPPGTHPPPLPTTIRIGKNPCGALLAHHNNDDGDESVLSKGLSSTAPNPSDTAKSNGLWEPRPVVLVFRRTKQRPPKAWNVWPNYRLDDECDVACQILESLTTTPALPSPNTAASHRQVPPPDSPRRRRSRDGSSTMWDDGSTSYTDDPSQYSSKKSGTSKVLFSTDDHGGFGNASEETDNVEASTIRGMIAKAVGLAFVRSNKVVFGVSVHGGSGIVLSRLSDGTWSSPSLIGMAGMGLGLQVGLEVANYIFILQTEQALEHFSRGGSFTLGANVGAAFAGMGREAIGAASVSPALCGISEPVEVIKEDEYNYEDDEEDQYEVVFDDSNDPVRRFRRREASCTTACGPRTDPSPQTVAECASGALDGTRSLAPIVAYAKSEGLYVGVSLEGSRIFARDESNAKAYKYSSYNHKAVTARDILTGKIVSRPPEAESLYALLHGIELTHEWTSLPAVPSAQWLVVPTSRSSEGDWTRPWDANSSAFLPPSETKGPDDEPLNQQQQPESDLDDFATKFRDLLFGGITVTRISPLKEKREQRTLWLSSPTFGDTANESSKHKKNSSFSERSSLKVGFVSKLYSATAQRKHLSASLIDDVHKSGHHGGDGGANTEMGDDLTLDSALMDNQSLLTTTGTLQERVELSKKLSMDLVDVLCLTQMTPPNVRLKDSSERDRVICLESSNDTQLVFLGNTVNETRLLYCGLKLLLEQETARMGIRGSRPSKKHGITSALKSKNRKSASSASSKYRKSSSSNASLGCASSDIDDTDDGLYDASEYYHATAVTPVTQRYPLPEGWRSWGRVPGRSYMRAQATSTDDGYPTYAHGQLLVRDLCKTVLLPLPLPLCRVLLLDSSSPVVSKWENERGDSDFERTPWTFPPATPREMDQFQSEHQLIASGSMCGAHRTVSYERYRNGRPIRLSETHIVDCDDSEKLAFQVSERLPRRGFSIKVKLLLRAVDNGCSCEATVLGEIRPVGKNMSDPAAVHKALLKVQDELRNRYGTDCVGLLAGFINVIENMPKDEALMARTSSGLGLGTVNSSSWRSGWEEKKEADPFPRNRGQRKSTTPKKVLEKTSVVKFEDVMNAELGISDVQDSRFLAPERRPGASTISDYKAKKTKPVTPDTETFGSSSADPVTIEVKPLPKIRLSLMPSPREEDEENLDEEGEPRNKSRSLRMSSRSGGSGRKSSRSKRSSFSKKKHRKKSSSSESGPGR